MTGGNEPNGLIECYNCGRSFNEQAIGKHENICKKVFSGKRKVFIIRILTFSDKMVEGSRVNQASAYANNAASDAHPPIYRATVLGNSLQEIINEMIRSNDLQEHHKD